jgi:hypothetical protein
MSMIRPVKTSWSVVRSSVFLYVILLTAGIDCASAQMPGADEAIEVRSYLDTQSAGWAFKNSDYAFVVESKGCRIQWNAVEMKEEGSKMQLSVRRDCPISFSEQVQVHRAILKEIFSKWPIADFDSISWGSFGSASDWSWNLPIAIASSKSIEYRDYRAHYPNSQVKNINAIFVKLANETTAYRDLQSLIQEFGADLELSSVEKVFVSEAKQLPFYHQLKDHGITGKSRLMYDVAFSYFKIKK